MNTELLHIGAFGNFLELLRQKKLPQTGKSRKFS